ncbi:hemerythrin domain-containing protein [uncultured Sphingomonas sp.]|uniref:hemerythrin domain-containing protein n=1 Tax=uncultured Sphingomonas sp. TaxID=158754 RepID=UPI0025E65881|nr:hemerythrin domain-containing protein [uncultured Sphingomonas sp.]
MSSLLPPIASYARLIGEHAEIASRAARLTTANARGEAAAVREALDELADALIEHLANEDREIHPRLMAARDGGVRISAQEARVRYETLATDWIALISDWPTARIAADRDGFAAESAALIDRLHARIREEDDLLYPAALASGQMALKG